MEEITGLRNQDGKTAVIYTQYTGENESFQNLSLVSRRRLAAMYKIYLNYLEEALGKIDQNAASSQGR